MNPSVFLPALTSILALVFAVALWQLLRVAPKKAREIPYDPSEPSKEKRADGIKAWRDAMKGQ